MFKIQLGTTAAFALVALGSGCADMSQSSSPGYRATSGYNDAALAYSRPYRSKCDDLADTFQREQCYKVELEDTDESRE